MNKKMKGERASISLPCHSLFRVRASSRRFTHTGARHPSAPTGGRPYPTDLSERRTRACLLSAPEATEKKMSQPTPMDASADNSLYPIAILM